MMLLFEFVGNYLKINDYGMNIIMMHYPMLTWPKVTAGSVMLHGHIHSDKSYNEANKRYGIRRYDVGVDANDYYPVSIETIKAFRDATPVSITSSKNLYIPGSGSRILCAYLIFQANIQTGFCMSTWAPKILKKFLTGRKMMISYKEPLLMRILLAAVSGA